MHWNRECAARSTSLPPSAPLPPFHSLWCNVPAADRATPSLAFFIFYFFFSLPSPSDWLLLLLLSPAVVVAADACVQCRLSCILGHLSGFQRGSFPLSPAAREMPGLSNAWPCPLLIEGKSAGFWLRDLTGIKERENEEKRNDRCRVELWWPVTCWENLLDR